jgi:hypothetical protein
MAGGIDSRFLKSLKIQSQGIASKESIPPAYLAMAGWYIGWLNQFLRIDSKVP